MTRALAAAARRIDVPPTRGLSRHAVRHVLATMAQIAQEDGTMLYGLPGSKLARLCDLSESLIHRARQWLRDNGYIQHVRTGGGRAPTLWRVVVDRLFPPAAGEATSPSPGEQLSHGGAVQSHTRVVQGFSPPNPRAAGEPSPPASTPPSGRCEHGRKSCRRCGTSPRGRARAVLVAAEQAGRACRMCVGAGPRRGGGTYWVRAVPGSQTAISPDQPCDHRTPTEVVEQQSVGGGRAEVMAFAATLPSSRAHTSRRDWRKRRSTERTRA